MTIIKSKALNRFPGDNLRVMTAAKISAIGERFPAGTEYAPISQGFDNQLNQVRALVSIAGHGNVAFLQDYQA